MTGPYCCVIRTLCNVAAMYHACCIFDCLEQRSANFFTQWLHGTAYSFKHTALSLKTEFIK